MKQKYNGFTLIELMVSVALMLIIIGMTMVIFNSTSTTFTVAEAKVDIMQNARLALDTIAKDIANATNIFGQLIQTDKNDKNKPNLLTLQIMTVTNWRENSESKTGKALVVYTLSPDKKFDNQQLYYLNRKILKETKNASGVTKYNDVDPNADNSIAEYLVAPSTTDDDHVNAPFYFEYFIHPGTQSQKWNYNESNQDQTTNYKIPTETNDKYYFTFDSELPPLVRITITVTDEHMNACRTLSRMIWIPKGIRRTKHDRKTK